MKLSRIENQDRLFVRATGTLEQIGLLSGYTVVPQAKDSEVGVYNTNNGTLVYVTDKKDYWIGRPTDDAISALVEAGYQRGSSWVPHSNDCGIRKNRLLAGLDEIANELALEKIVAEKRSRISPVQDRDEYFVVATGTLEFSASEEKIIGRGNPENIGDYCSNNGTLAFVDSNRLIYIGKNTAESINLLHQAGYQLGSFWVPHSNDSGQARNRLMIGLNSK